MVRTSLNPFLLHQLSRGEYEVDAWAVAEAMLTRPPRARSAGGEGSGVLVALERIDRLVVPPEEDGPRAA
jgi:hypothetical protein